MARESGGDDVSIDINALVSDIGSMTFGNISMSPRRCIFKVPNILSRHKQKAYEPNAFSIGPLHYNESHLKATQKIKVQYLHGLLSRFTDRETKLRDLTEAIGEVREEALECYGGDINGMSMAEFVKVLILDGCFLIELFCKFVNSNLREDDDPIFTMNCMHEFLYHDLILLENQIPWLVLELLFEKTKPSEDTTQLNILAISYFNNIFSANMKILEQTMGSPNFVKHENKHILDLLRNSIVLPSSIFKKEETGALKKREKKIEENGTPHIKWPRMPSTTSLRESGIKFREAKSVASILDIEFKDGVLNIPQLHIQETTESLFRNLICLEQCLPNCEGFITSYAILLDHLIDTPKDTVILYKNKVIFNWLDIEDATKFFNQLYHDTCVSSFHYRNLINEVNTYCERRWPRYRRALIRDYFKHPWALTSVIAAALLLLLTFLQTVFTIMK